MEVELLVWECVKIFYFILKFKRKSKIELKRNIGKVEKRYNKIVETVLKIW